MNFKIIFLIVASLFGAIIAQGPPPPGRGPPGQGMGPPPQGGCNSTTESSTSS